MDIGQEMKTLATVVKPYRKLPVRTTTVYIATRTRRCNNNNYGELVICLNLFGETKKKEKKDKYQAKTLKNTRENAQTCKLAGRQRGEKMSNRKDRIHYVQGELRVAAETQTRTVTNNNYVIRLAIRQCAA